MKVNFCRKIIDDWDLVPKAYTVKQCKEERVNQKFSYDPRNMQIRGCQVANGVIVSFTDEATSQWY